jgi:HSP20 family molecular chaperone IbpA
MSGMSSHVVPHRVSTTARDMFLEDPHFKENWENWGEVKNSMMKESRDMWKKMDSDFKRMRCMQDNVLLNKDLGTSLTPSAQRYEDSWMFPRRWMLPSLQQSNQLQGQLDLFRADHDHDVIRIKDDEKMLEVSLDTSHYRPDEIHVHVEHNSVTVEARHQEKSGDGRRILTRQFKRTYTIPEGTCPENVTSNLAADGVLVVKALKGKPSHNVPIQCSK